MKWTKLSRARVQISKPSWWNQSVHAIHSVAWQIRCRTAMLVLIRWSDIPMQGMDCHHHGLVFVVPYDMYSESTVFDSVTWVQIHGHYFRDTVTRSLVSYSSLRFSLKSTLWPGSAKLFKNRCADALTGVSLHAFTHYATVHNLIHLYVIITAL